MSDAYEIPVEYAEMFDELREIISNSPSSYTADADKMLAYFEHFGLDARDPVVLMTITLTLNSVLGAVNTTEGSEPGSLMFDEDARTKIGLVSQVISATAITAFDSSDFE